MSRITSMPGARRWLTTGLLTTGLLTTGLLTTGLLTTGACRPGGVGGDGRGRIADEVNRGGRGAEAGLAHR